MSEATGMDEMVQEVKEITEDQGRSQGSTCERVARGVRPCREGWPYVGGGAGRMFQGGGSGQKGQILLWMCGVARMKTEICPLDDLSRRHW